MRKGPKSKIKITPYEYQEMRHYMTTKEIAAHEGIKLQALYAWCYANGVYPGRVTDWELQEALKIMTPKEAAYELNLPLNTVYVRMCRMRKKGL